jgi:hypothetical protein
MTRKPIQLCGIYYPTQKEFGEFVKQLIYKTIGPCENIKATHPTHYQTILHVLRRHPRFDAKTVHMSYLKLTQDPLNSRALKMIIVNYDNTEVDISWKIAITGCDHTIKRNLMSAMRSSVEDQILYFKTNSRQVCSLCSSVDIMDVDHIIQFEELADTFLKSLPESKQLPQEFDDMTDDTSRRQFRDEDYMLRDRWVDYHKQNATLRILCRPCNLNRPNFNSQK